MLHFTFYRQEYHLAYTAIRPGEQRLGEVMPGILNEKRWTAELQRSPARFVIVGIKESYGLPARYEVPGISCWNEFLRHWMNLQAKGPLHDDRLLLLGCFDFQAPQNLTELPVEILREQVAKADKEVAALVSKIAAAGKIPVLIGGSAAMHFGVLHGAAQGLRESGKSKSGSVNAISISGHSGFGLLNGRHAGNALAYAFADGSLGRCGILGLIEDQVPESEQEELVRNRQLRFATYEELFVREEADVYTAFDDMLSFTKPDNTALLFDLQHNEIDQLSLRRLMHRAAEHPKVCLLHFTESSGADGGKRIAELLSDWIKASA